MARALFASWKPAWPDGLRDALPAAWRGKLSPTSSAGARGPPTRGDSPRVQVCGEAAAKPVSPRAPTTVATAVPAAPRLATLGRYRVESEIGRGAMGIVLLGRDPETGQPVALKTMALSREFEGDALTEARRRFLREARTVGRLRHPDIVSILGCGQEQGLAWIAMEYLPGRDLNCHALPGDLLPTLTVLPIGARVADALAYAHGQGVVHRDVKPANVMVDLASGSVKVTDFGIARIAHARRTRTGVMLGSPLFMSPEQFAGQQVDGRSDLYSLGAMLFQLLCGQPPHQADSMSALMRQIARQRAPDIRSLRPELPETLAALLARTLEKRPELRPADGHGLAQELRLIAERLAGPQAAEGRPRPQSFEATVTFSRNDPGHNPVV